MKVAANSRICSQVRSLSTSTRSTPSPTRSRIRRSGSGRSSCTSAPCGVPRARSVSTSQSLRRNSMSARSASAVAPSAAVRTM